MFEHSRHKDHKSMYRYIDKDRPITGPDPELVSSVNWELPFQQFSRIEEIPEPYRAEVRRKGSHIYHQLPGETFAWLSKRSLRHRANVVSDGSVVISALDTSKASLEAFQPIAKIALQQEESGHIKISNPHKSSIHSGNLYDTMIISRV